MAKSLTPPTPDTAIGYPPILWEESQRILRRLEKKADGRVISYFTAGSSRIHPEDVKYFYAHLKKIGRQKKLYFVLVSHGGSGESAWRIACLLRSFCEELIVLLPEVAASAATILSLAADRIIMTPLAYLTAVDTSIYHPLNPKDHDGKPVYVELDEVNRSINVLLQKSTEVEDIHEVYKTIFAHLHPVALGAIARSTNLSEMLCEDVMELRKTKVPDGLKKKIIEQLNTRYPSHSYPIPRHKAKELGLPVADSDAEMDDLLGSLLNLYVHITHPARTYRDETHIHTESVDAMIETHGLRFSHHHTIQKRWDRLLKNWLTFKDDYRWISLSPKRHNGKTILRQSEIDF